MRGCRRGVGRRTGGLGRPEKQPPRLEGPGDRVFAGLPCGGGRQVFFVSSSPCYRVWMWGLWTDPVGSVPCRPLLFPTPSLAVGQAGRDGEQFSASIKVKQMVTIDY